MRVRATHIGIGVLVFNVGLVLLTFGLSHQAQIQNPREGTVVDVGPISMHAIDIMPDEPDESSTGSYDALILIHGSSTSALDFKSNLLPAFADTHRVVALDRPGHGYSDRGDNSEIDNPAQQASLILETLSQMQIKNPVLIGHSWAGSVVLAALLTEHESVEPVAGVLIAGVTHPYEREDSRPTKLALTPYIGPVFRWQYLTPMGRMAIPGTVERFFSPDEVPEDYIRDTGLYLSLRPDTYLYNAQDRSRLTDHLADQSVLYSNINKPLLSIAATEDHVVPPSDHHDKLIEDVSSIQSVKVDGAGHSPHHTRTDEVVRAIEDFLNNL